MEEAGEAPLAITQNITLDGSIELLGDWFDPQVQAGADNSDPLEELRRQDGRADAFLAGRRILGDLRGCWPAQSDDAPGITDYLNRVRFSPVVPWRRSAR